MGSSETGSGAVDSCVGSIVWVRRRNGSWWPGKILGPDELPASHITSPRSGTPVKLLGREDASVDWYNLEKSKRVKSFRCGEFDECILRAEASQGMPPKKREKYARREDAILHALELEKQLLGKKYGMLDYSSNAEQNELPDVVGKELVVFSDGLEIGGAKQLNCKPNQESSIHGLSIETENTCHSLSIGKVSEVYQMNGDGAHTSPLYQVRHVQECGHITTSEHNHHSSEAADGSLQPFSNKTLHDSFHVGSSIVDIDGNSLLEKQDKQRPLVQVLQNSVQIPSSQPNMDTPIFVSGGEQEDCGRCAKRSRHSYLSADSRSCLSNKRAHLDQMENPTCKLDPSSPADLYEEVTSGSAEDTETDSSDTETTELDTDDDISADGAASIGLEAKYPRRIGIYAEDGSASSEEYDELALADDILNSYYEKPVSASEGVSRWQLKGKRNNRSFVQRSPDPAGGEYSGGSVYGANIPEKWSSGFYGSDSVERSLVIARTVGYGSRGVDVINRETHNRDNLASKQAASKGYWEDLEECFSPAYAARRQGGGSSVLIDVDLEVKASYLRSHVPLISMTSKLNGHAIVGHPIQIERLENGFSEAIIAASDGFYPEVTNYSTALAPVWRTARRTANSRVPRSHPRSGLGSEESGMIFQVGAYHDGKIFFEKPNVGASCHKVSMMKDNVANSLLDRRYSKKQAKRIISLSCNQKTRTLSSIASQQNQSNNVKYGGNFYQESGLIKPDSVPTTVACIPVNLVFSRLHEEFVGRHQ